MPGTLPIRQYDLVICDIDGCLVSEGQEAFDLESLAKIAHYNRLAMERGDRPMVTVCTGRPQPFAEAVCRLIGNVHVPCVCEMGVWVYDPATNRYEMDPAIGPGHMRAVRELSAWCHEQWGASGVTQQPGKNASVTLWHADTAHLRTLAPLVEAKCSEMNWPFRVSMTWFYINCDLAHISKGTGLDRLSARLRIPRARLAGIGDTTSDKCIAERVAFFACPSNAQAAIKEHAHMIAKGAEAKGVVEILESLVG
jgi:hypothetical protein